MPSLLVLLSLLQRPGQTTFDTKFDLTADPGAFLGRSLTLWNPLASFGELQNQAYGYLFPQGPFFLLGQWLHVPDWVTQRLWSALVLVVAYEGARRLFRALVAEQPWAACAAGAAYALAPRLLGLDGVLTGEVLPTALLPWVVLPLVVALHGRLEPRLAALLAGCALLCMGGVNAVENLAALPLPFLVVLSGWRRPRGRALLGWWSGACALAAAWWILPLLVLGRYSPPFLDYIETAAATTRFLGWTNVLRGADHWVGFVTVGGQPWWPAAYALFTTWWGIVTTAGVAAVGLAGLVRRDMPLRAPLLLSVLLGLACLFVGHGGTWGSPLAETVRTLLDGPLSPLRNVHKVDPLVRLPIALGVGHVVVLLSRARSSEEGRPGVWRAPVLARFAALGLVVLLLVTSGLPLLTDAMRKPGWQQVPRAWREAAAYVARERGDGRVLVLPGSGFAEQFWGSTIDEPLQGISDAPWVARNQVPLAPGPTIRFLDAIEERIADGKGSPGLADALARAGVTLVLVRRDLSEASTDAPTPDRVDQAIAASPGLRSVATFGRSLLGSPSMLQVYRVEPHAAVPPRVEATDLDAVRTVAGDSGDVLTMLESGVLATDDPVVFGNGSRRTPLLAQGDGLRRVERQFGRVHDAVSQVMSLDDPLRIQRPAPDYPGPVGQHRAYLHHDSVQSMTASSSVGYADTPGGTIPERGPYAAVDGSLQTFWQSAPLQPPAGQWLQLRLREALPVDELQVATGVGAAGVSVRQIVVDAGQQHVTAPVDPDTGRAVVQLDGSQVHTLRITVTKVLGDTRDGVVAIREVSFPGLVTSSTLVMPDQHAGRGTTFVLRSTPPRTTCAASAGAVPDPGSCRPLEVRPGEAEDRMSRQVTVHGAGRWSVRGTVVARSSAAARRLTEPLGDAVRVRSGSVLGDDLMLDPQRAYDGRPRTWWLASPGDLAPVLHLRWQQPRTLSRIQVRPAPLGVLPSVVVLRAGHQQRRVDLRSSYGFFKPLTTDHLRVVLQRAPHTQPDGRSVGVSELHIDGLDDLRYRMPLEARTGARCGFGPPVVVDGVVVATRVTGTFAQLLTGAPMTMRSCSGTVRMGPGSHRIDTVSTRQFVPVTTVLAPAAAPPPASPERRSTHVESWGSTSRTVRVGAGARALLTIRENANPGWTATLDGHALEPLSVDGWMQGFVVPRGKGGLVDVTFRPQLWYSAALGVGALAALVLVAGAAAALVRRRRSAPDADDLPWSVTPSRRRRLARPRSRLARPVAVVALAVVAALVGGPAVLVGSVGAAVVVVVRGDTRLLPGLVAVLTASAGVVAAANGVSGWQLWSVADLLAGLGVGALAVAAVPARLLSRGDAP